MALNSVGNGSSTVGVPRDNTQSASTPPPQQHPTESFQHQPSAEVPARPPVNWGLPGAPLDKLKAMAHTRDGKGLLALVGAGILYPPLGIGLATYYGIKGMNQPDTPGTPPATTGIEKVQRFFTKGNEALGASVDSLMNRASSILSPAPPPPPPAAS